MKDSCCGDKTKLWFSIEPSKVTSKILRSNLYVVKINKGNYHKWTSQIKYLIELFNSEHNWDDMWTLEDSQIRFNEGFDFYILLDGVTPIGYVWYDDCYLFNLFVSKKRKDGDSYQFVNYTLADRTQDEIKLYTDAWNIKAQKLFTKIGFKEYTMLWDS